MQTSKVWLDALVIGDRLRKEVDAENVGHLAESMSRIGLQHPISVWKDADDGVHLIAGLHRVRAAEKLGWEQIDAFIVQMDEDDRVMWEAVENLHRANLTADDRRESIRAYHEAWMRKQAREVSSQNVKELPNPAGGRPKGVIQKVAEDLGVSHMTVRRAINPPLPKPVSPPDAPRNPNEAFNAWLARINKVWGEAPQEWREQFLEQIDRPVFDSTRAA